MNNVSNIVKNVSFLTAIGVLLLVSGCSGSKDESVSKLAQCLKSQGATMYGTNRCSHCQAQKELFGYEAFTKVNFVDCDKQKNACVLAGVEGYPTWVFKNGTRLQGTQTLEKLASQAGCTMDGTVAVAATTGTVGELTTTGDMMTGDTAMMTGTGQVVSGAIGTGN